MKPTIAQVTSLSILLLLPITGSGAALGTRQRTITPVALTNATPVIFPSAVSNYAVYGYSAWQWGPGEDEGQQLTNMPAGYTGATNAARLLSFLSISDAHITDKETPCQAIYLAYQGSNGSPSACYSPVMLYTTQVLDAAIRTANAVNRLTPFDFALSLGDDANGPQYNELRWFINVVDGQHITPSSGTHAGADTIDYQKPFQAAGLDPAIPWYAVLGNHDHFWMGGLPVPASQDYFTNTEVLRLGDNYMGTIDGSTPYGDVIDVGSVTNFVVGGVTNTPMVAADTNRYSLTTSNWMSEFFNTTSKPIGHGFSETNVASNFACYSFQPRTNLPVKVVVLDDTMSDQDFAIGEQGCLDPKRFDWLVKELDRGQAHDQLMIIAAHVPLELIDTNSTVGTNTIIPLTHLLATLHTYPNLLLWMCGHTHQNNIIPQPSPYPDRPEYGFWEVQTASLRDFPHEFRTFEILRNTDNSISILVTDIDPEATTNSPAAISLGYAVGAARIYGSPCTSLTDTNSYAHNAELLKLLTPPMQAVIAGYGGPLGHNVAIDRVGNGVVINFLGALQSADTLLGPWNTVTSVSPYTVEAANAATYYRAAE